MSRALFVTATGTDAGKTYVTALIVKRLREAGINVIGFGAGQPDFDTPEHIKAAAVEALKNENL